MSTHLTDMVDEVRALSNRLYDSRDASDRSIADQLAEMAERFTAALVPLDADMGPATHHPGHATERAAGLLAMPRGGTLREKVVESLYRTVVHVEPWDAGVLIGPGPADLITDGMTQEQVALYTGEYLYSIAPRFAELQRMGWIKDSGRTRPTAKGTQAIVWVLTDDGLRKWAAR